MIELPKKLKKQIIAFTERYWELARPKKMMITIEKIVQIEIVWDSDDKISINDKKCDYTPYDSKEVKEYNEKIRHFIKEANAFGIQNFDDQEWLWHNILWNFRPERGEKYNFKKVKWV